LAGIPRKHPFFAHPPVEFVRTKLNRANMAAGTMKLSGRGQRLDSEDAGNPPKNEKIAILAVWEKVRS
jgi:hypothetical protein